jgi:predicted transcriptional regulator
LSALVVSRKGVAGLSVSRKDEQYYTIREVAEIKGITRQSVLEGCKRGQYPGAYKTPPDGMNRQGVWMIPKQAIDEAVMTQEVATVTRALTPADLQAMIDKAVGQKIQEHEQRLEQRLENHDKLLMEILRAIQEKNEKKKKPFWRRFWK